MSSSSRPIAASRAIGKKPYWPVTPARKTRPAANGTCPGFASPESSAQLICLKSENPADCIGMHEALIVKHAPATAMEHILVQHIAITGWRLQRARLMENARLVMQMDQMMDDHAQTHESMDETVRAALCLKTLTQTSPSFKFLLRYKRSLSRQFDRWLACLALLRTGAENKNRETNPKMNNRNG